MLLPHDYTFKCFSLGIKPSYFIYNEYVKYEYLWNNYINSIVLPNIFKSKPKCIRLIICESCPKPNNNIHPYQNFIFNNLGNLFIPSIDKYLDQIWKGISQTKIIPQGKTKSDVLIDLILNPGGSVIILDILPSHGINITTENRKRVSISPINCAEIQKINDLVKLLKKNVPNVQIMVTFATPPTTASNNLKMAIDPYCSFYWTQSTINSGQGHKPSWKKLSCFINQGFKCGVLNSTTN